MSCAHVALKYLIKATKYMPEISYAPQPCRSALVDLRGVLGQRKVNRAYTGPVEDNEEERATSTRAASDSEVRGPRRVLSLSREGCSIRVRVAALAYSTALSCGAD